MQPEWRRQNCSTCEEFNLIEGLAVLPLRIRRLGDVGVGCGHHGDQDVGQDDHNDHLVQTPHCNSHEMRELIRNLV